MNHSKYFSMPDGHAINTFMVALSKIDLLNNWSIKVDHMELHEDFSLMVTDLHPIGMTVTM
jgi:hypothetical protein